MGRLFLISTDFMVFDAIRSGEIETVRRLIYENPDLGHRRDERGFTPLVMATYSNQLEIAELLIEKGADVNEQDAMGNTPLMGVCFKGNLEIIEMLLAKGADVHFKNSKGDSALSYAKMSGNAEVISLIQQVSEKA